MARGVVPFWGEEQTDGVISPDPHPSHSPPEQDPAHVCTQTGVVSGAQGDGVLGYLNCQCWVFRGDLATEVKSGQEGGSGKVRVGETPAGVAGIRGPGWYCPWLPRLGLRVSVTDHGNSSKNPHTSVNSFQASRKSRHQKIREEQISTLILKGRTN